MSLWFKPFFTSITKNYDGANQVLLPLYLLTVGHDDHINQNADA